MVELVRSSGGIHVTGALATVFVCPFDGIVPVEQVGDVVGPLVDMGLDQISLSDTLGKADPAHVDRVVVAMRQAHPDVVFGLHLHNSYGMGMAKPGGWPAPGRGAVRRRAGGFGGCPFAPGAAGNIATEDVVFMLEAMAVSTGIELDRLATAATELQRALAAPLASAVSRALGWVA